MITQTFSNAVGGFAEGIVYAADNGAIVSQNSWGYTSEGTFEQAVLDAIDYFRANAGGSSAPMDGGVFVNSSGNSDSSGEWYPGFYEPSYAVSSTEDTDTKSSFSNYGDWIDVAAPGGQFGEDGVWSTVVGGFGSQSGTSMAAPHVSGVIGLVASASPGLTNDQMETLLINTGKDISGN
jgi:subtilisin family serine protease